MSKISQNFPKIVNFLGNDVDIRDLWCAATGYGNSNIERDASAPNIRINRRIAHGNISVRRISSLLLTQTSKVGNGTTK